MKYFWSPLMLLFAYLEYGEPNICGSIHMTGQMWFMWLIMGLMSSKPYMDLIKREIKWQSQI